MNYTPIIEDYSRALFFLILEKRGEEEEEKEVLQSSLKPLKAKTTKVERRALQEAQRAAKAASKGCLGFVCSNCYLFSPFITNFIGMID